MGGREDGEGKKVKEERGERNSLHLGRQRTITPDISHVVTSKKIAVGTCVPRAEGDFKQSVYLFCH